MTHLISLIRLLSLITILLVGTQALNAQNLYFPPLSGTTWDTVSPTTLGWCEDKIDDLLNYLDDRNSKAFIVLKDGRIVIEHYFDSFTKDSIWYWASAGKSLTAFLVGIAKQEGFLSLDDTTSHYLGSGWTVAPTAKEEKITIRHQLSMTSGLDDGVPDHHCTIDTCLQYLADAGTRWAYHNGPYTLLDDVMLNATGITLNSFHNSRVKSLTGMDGAFIPLGYNNVYFSTARSMARYGLLILDHGNWDGTAVLSDSGYFNEMVNTSQPLNESYGYLWWLNGKGSFMVPTLQLKFPGSLFSHAPDDMISGLGKNGQIVDVVPSENLVVVRMGEATAAGEVPLLFNDTIWIKLNEIMCHATGMETSLDRASIHVYPNPAFDMVKVDMPPEMHLEKVSLLNAGGQLIRTFYHKEFHVSEISEGVYFILVQTDREILVIH